MQLNLSSDHACWDNTEPVTVERLDRTKRLVSRLAVPVAKGQRIRYAQKSPSGGAYLGFERTWHIPARDLPGDATVQPGDVVVDQDGVRWTALVVDWSRLKQRWKADCVALSLAKHLVDDIVVERATIAYDNAGVSVKTFPPQGGKVLYTVKGRVQEISRTIAEERGIRYGKGMFEVIIDRELDLLIAEDRIKTTHLGAVVYLDISAYRNSDRIDELPVLECELRV